MDYYEITNSKYDEIVKHMAAMAREDIADGIDKDEAIMQAIDDGTMHYEDMAVIMAHHVITTSRNLYADGEEVYAELYKDVEAIIK